jgi:hypothetical protein
VALVEQPVHRSAAPPNVELHRSIERSEDGAKGTERDRIKVPAFEHGHLLLTDACPQGEVCLAPPEAQPECTDQPSDSNVVHPEIVDDRALPRLITRAATRSQPSAAEASVHDPGP